MQYIEQITMLFVPSIKTENILHVYYNIHSIYKNMI